MIKVAVIAKSTCPPSEDGDEFGVYPKDGVDVAPALRTDPHVRLRLLHCSVVCATVNFVRRYVVTLRSLFRLGRDV